MSYASLRISFVLGNQTVSLLGASLLLLTNKGSEEKKYSFKNSFLEELGIATIEDMEIANLMLVNKVSRAGLSIASSDYLVFPPTRPTTIPQEPKTKITHVWYLNLPEEYDTELIVSLLELTEVC